MQIIAISGVSGAGKTSLGQALAVQLNSPFISMDWYTMQTQMELFPFENNLEELEEWKRTTTFDIELSQLRRDIDQLKTLNVGDGVTLHLEQNFRIVYDIRHNIVRRS